MSVSKGKLIAAALTAVIALSGPALSHGKRGGPQMNFEDVDANNNGSISIAEIKAHGLSRAKAMDTNNDGNISEAELKAAHEQRAEGKRGKKGEQRAGRMIERADANNDGVLSVAELVSHRDGRLNEMFEKLDADSNGELSQDELKNGRKGRKSKRSE